MTCRIVVLDGGTVGTLVANRLRRRFTSAEAQFTVGEKDDVHVQVQKLAAGGEIIFT